MAGGAPIPIPTADLEEKILSITDLEKAASKKLAQNLKGSRPLFPSCWPWLLCHLYPYRRPLALSHSCQIDQADAWSGRNFHTMYDMDSFSRTIP